MLLHYPESEDVRFCWPCKTVVLGQIGHVRGCSSSQHEKERKSLHDEGTLGARRFFGDLSESIPLKPTCGLGPTVITDDARAHSLEPFGG